MSNHEEEQALEIEALQSIFEEGKEFERVSDTEFKLKLLPFPAGEEENHVGVTFRVTYTAEYPDTPPDWDLQDVKGLSDEKIEKLRSVISESIDSSLGMAMIYTVAEALQDFLKSNNQKSLSMHEEMMLRLSGQGQDTNQEEDGDDDDDEDEDDEGEEPEWKGLADKALCLENERISPESFNAWKLKFDEEMVALGILKRGESKAQTGKEFFVEAKQQAGDKESATPTGAAKPDALVYNAALFGEEEDEDLDEPSGGED